MDYNKEHYININFRLNKDSEKHIIEHIKAQDNIKRYITALIIGDMYGEKKKNETSSKRKENNK